MKKIRSFQWGVYTAAILGCLVVGALVGTLCISYLQKEHKEDIEKYYVERAESVSDQISSLLEDLNTVAIEIQSNQTLQRMLVEANSSQYAEINYFSENLENRKNAQGIIWMFAAARNDITGIHIFTGSSYVGMREAPAADKVRELACDELWNFPEYEIRKVIGRHTDQWDMLQNREVISVARIFEATDYNFAHVAVIEVQAKYKVLEGICAASEDVSEKITVYSKSDGLIYSSRTPNDEFLDMISDYADNSPGFYKDTINGEDTVSYVTDVKDSDWIVIIQDDAKVFNPGIRSVIPVTFISAIPIFLLIILSTTLATGKIIRPILRLTEEIKKISPEDPYTDFEPSHVKEVDTLQNAFTAILSAANEAKEKLILSQKTELNLRIEALQSQINPHYLFNSLSAISAVATEENSTRVPIMCYELGEQFRYVSDEDQSPKTLAEELEHITHYLHFMKWRYEENLQTEINITGDPSSVTIAKLSLQPLVENCFTHGFKKTFPPYSIRIDCNCDNTGWYFYIADNGCGFDAKTVHSFSEMILEADQILKKHNGYEKLKSKNMAIMNLYIRLKMQYGEKLWFEILKDESLGGALVKIVVEYDRKEP